MSKNVPKCPSSPVLVVCCLLVLDMYKSIGAEQKVTPKCYEDPLECKHSTSALESDTSPNTLHTDKTSRASLNLPSTANSGYGTGLLNPPAHRSSSHRSVIAPAVKTPSLNAFNKAADSTAPKSHHNLLKAHRGKEHGHDSVHLYLKRLPSQNAMHARARTHRERNPSTTTLPNLALSACRLLIHDPRRCRSCYEGLDPHTASHTHTRTHSLIQQTLKCALEKRKPQQNISNKQTQGYAVSTESVDKPTRKRRALVWDGYPISRPLKRALLFEEDDSPRALMKKSLLSLCPHGTNKVLCFDSYLKMWVRIVAVKNRMKRTFAPGKKRSFRYRRDRSNNHPSQPLYNPSHAHLPNGYQPDKTPTNIVAWTVTKAFQDRLNQQDAAGRDYGDSYPATSTAVKRNGELCPTSMPKVKCFDHYLKELVSLNNRDRKEYYIG